MSFCYCAYEDVLFNGTIDGNNFVVGTDVYHLPSVPLSTTGHFFVPEQCSINDKKYNIKSFHSYAFYETKIVSFTFSPFVESLSHGVMEFCASLVFVDLSRTKIKEIPKYCFARCFSLSKVLLPFSVKELKSHCFYQGSSLKELTIPYRIRAINENAFLQSSIENISFCKTRSIDTNSINTIKNVFVP